MLILIVILGICVNYTNNAALTNQELKRYKNLIEGQGLYRADEDVYVLTVNNFKKQLYGKPHANIVEFYNSWCGFCQRFQPIWSALASDIRNWKDRVLVSAIDCSDDDNSPICRDFEILNYPTLRYFHEDYKEISGNIGVNIEKGTDMQEHKTLLLKQIVLEQNQGRAKMLANIVPYSVHNLTISHIFQGVQDDVQYVFLIVEPKETEMLGAEIAIDLQNVAKIAIKYVVSDNVEVLKHVSQGITVYSKDSSEKPLVLNVPRPQTRENMINTIREFLETKSILIPLATNNKNVFTGKWKDVVVPNSDALQLAYEKNALRQKIKKMGDTVFQGDLETALRHSLKREIVIHKTITGGEYEALQKYLGVLVKYFPFGQKGRAFLQDLLEKVVSSGGTIEGVNFAKWMKNAENPNQQVFSSPPQWLACEGSSLDYRGYPCGLWKLFHYLTVNAAEFNINNEQAYPLEVLEAMLGYVKYFFGCTDCSQHFQEMADEKDMKGVVSLDSAILWLWMAHNTVNRRLSGDYTEDPEYPKIQFPSGEHCPTCRNLDKTWNLPEVLRYLKTVYSNINIRYIGSDTKVLHQGLEGSKANVYSNESSIFKQMDTSMFLILYVVSFILIVILIRMFLKHRPYTKKIYVHDLLGKV